MLDRSDVAYVKRDAAERRGEEIIASSILGIWNSINDPLIDLPAPKKSLRCR